MCIMCTITEMSIWIISSLSLNYNPTPVDYTTTIQIIKKVDTLNGSCIALSQIHNRIVEYTSLENKNRRQQYQALMIDEIVRRYKISHSCE